MKLKESQLRYLQRIAHQMAEGYTGRIEIDLASGGVGGFREIRSIKPADMPESNGIAEVLDAQGTR